MRLWAVVATFLLASPLQAGADGLPGSGAPGVSLEELLPAFDFEIPGRVLILRGDPTPVALRSKPDAPAGRGLSLEFLSENWDHPSVIAGTTDHGWIRNRIDEYEELRVAVSRPVHRLLRAEFAWRGAQRSRVSRSFDYRRQVFGVYVHLLAD